MVFDKLRRRSYLGGAAAALTGLAGCNTRETETEPAATDSPSESATEPDPSATASATDAATQADVPEHDHSESAEGGGILAPEEVDADRVGTGGLDAETVAARELNGVVYAAHVEGEDLSMKVRNAIDAVPAGGTVVVTPRPDDEPWQWSETVRINLNERGALTLLFRGHTMIEYTGNSWALETTYRPAEYGTLSSGDFLTLRGGNWRATGNPDGWLRMIDTNFCEIAPQRVIDFTNDEKTATGIRVEIQEIFSESNVFTGHFATVDIGMDFVPSDTPGIAGGEAAASFQGNYVRNVKVLNASKYGFRWRDGSQCQAMTVQNPDAFSGTFNAADEVVLYYLGGDFDGAVFLGPKTEDAGSTSEENDVNDIAFELPDALSSSPLVIAPELGNNVDTVVRRDDRFKTLPTLKVWDDGRKQQGGIYDLGRLESSPKFLEGGMHFPPQTFSGAEQVLPRREGKVVFHPGNENVAAGLYRADPENDQWIKVSDNSVTVPA